MGNHENFEPKAINLLETGVEHNLDKNVVAGLLEIRDRMLAIEVEAAKLDGQLRLAGNDRVRDDVNIEKQLDELAAQYSDLRDTFRAKIDGINNYRRELGQEEVEMAEPDDEEIRSAMRAESGLRKAA